MVMCLIGSQSLGKTCVGSIPTPSAKYAAMVEIGRHVGLKIPCLRASRFDPGWRYQYWYGGILVYTLGSNPSALLGLWVRIPLPVPNADVVEFRYTR